MIMSGLRRWMSLSITVVDDDQVRPGLDVTAAADVLVDALCGHLDVVGGDDLVGPPTRRAGITTESFAGFGVILGQTDVVDEFVLDVVEELGGLVGGVGE